MAHSSSSTVACCLPAGIDSKAMLAENWVTKSAEAAEAAAAAAGTAPPAFNPADPQFNELARRLSQSAAMHRVQELHAAVAQHEKQLQQGLTGEAKEAKKAEIEEAQQQLSEAQAALTELQASYEQDPLSLTPWMNALFALADSGCTTFDTGGSVSTAHLPPDGKVPLLELLAPPVAASGGPAGVSAWLYRGAERVLGAFKRRYDLERGAGRVRVTARLALSPFGGTPAAELAASAEAAVEASRQAVLGPEGAAAGGLLDTLLLHWLDYEDLGSFVSVLLALKRLLAPPGYDPDNPDLAASVAAGETPPKLAALGLVNPPAAALTAAVRAGVPISCVSLPFSLLDTSAAPLVVLCAQQGITVYAEGPTAHGLISETHLGCAPPSSCKGGGIGGGGGGAVAGCDNLAAGLDGVARYGGWPRFQELLSALKAIAAQPHGGATGSGTSLQVVALAWLQQQGVVPLLPAHWGPATTTTTSSSSNSSTPPVSAAEAAAGGSGGSGASAAAAAAAAPLSVGAPWPLTLGLQHYKLDPPPPLLRSTPAPAAPADASPAAAAAEEGLAAEGAEAEQKAAASEEAVAEPVAAAGGGAAEGGEATAEGHKEEEHEASAAVVVKAARGCWVDGLGQLLGRDELLALGALAGRAAA